MRTPIQHDTKSTHKAYLGDGLYVRYDGYQVWLTSENGIEVLDAVALDASTLLAFENWLKGLRR